jgi:uncharacterized membrane protein
MTILVTLALSSSVMRIAAVVTGLSREAAGFQARSAFTGVGFTTGESELIVRHPVRRRIVSMPMLLGGVGLVTAAASVVATSVHPAADVSGRTRLLHLGAGYRVAQVQIEEGDWMADRELAELDLASRGLLVLGLAHPDVPYEGAPDSQVRLVPGCTLFVYGLARKLHKVCGKTAS